MLEVPPSMARDTNIVVFILGGTFDIAWDTYIIVFVEFIEDNATMSSIRYFENHVSYFVQNRRK